MIQIYVTVLGHLRVIGTDWQVIDIKSSPWWFTANFFHHKSFNTITKFVVHIRFTWGRIKI